MSFMRPNIIVFLCTLLVAGVALAGSPVLKLTPKEGVTAATVSKAGKHIKVGEYQNGDDPLLVFCSGANQSLACEVQQPDGTVVAKSKTFKNVDGNLVMSLECAGGATKFGDMKVEIPGTLLRFGGQGMGEF
jgi:hypothetical protein